ncbi:FG-GAP repeat protein [Micavibrio aeruginosavorus]|uniref:FG-GAP repeat protein n=1 Tax=Micavibrio aeruginosavorus TaxID=349221 RepID=UPI001F2FC1AE|nr:FG-GAP repeat protein [Micavibrio aeruginosavorus]
MHFCSFAPKRRLNCARSWSWACGLAFILLFGVVLVPGSALAACASPTGVAGDMIWSSAGRAPAYCDGANWRGFPKGGYSWSSPITGAIMNNPSPTSNDQFGSSISLSGNLILVGAVLDESNGTNGTADAGRAYVFDIDTGALVSTLNNPSPNANDYFGGFVGLSGTLALVGAENDESNGTNGTTDAGRAYVFNALTGALVSTLNNPSATSTDNFGWTAGLSGNLAAIGAPNDESDGGAGVANAGRAYVFNATTGALVSTLNNPAPHTNDQFGYSIAIDGNLVAVGTPNDAADGTSGVLSGRAYVFNATTGALVSSLNNPYPNATDYFSNAIAISGNRVVVGAPWDESDGTTGTSSAGRAYVFNATTGALISTINNPTPHANDYFGVSVSISGNIVAVGAPYDESNGTTGTADAGRVYLFSADTGALITAISNPTPNNTDWFGNAVSVNGQRLGVAAPLDESNGTNGTADAGRVYAFSVSSGTTSCANPAGNVGDVSYNTTSHVLQYCDGHAWYAAGAPGNGGAGCTNPTGVEGAVTYNNTHKVLQYCEGDVWMAVGDLVPPTCGGVVVGTYCWYYGGDGQSCNTVCASRGGCNATGLSYAAGSTANCTAVLDAIGAPGAGYYFQGYAALNVGCSYAMGNGRVRDTSNTCGGSVAATLRACACNN